MVKKVLYQLSGKAWNSEAIPKESLADFFGRNHVLTGSYHRIELKSNQIQVRSYHDSQMDLFLGKLGDCAYVSDKNSFADNDLTRVLESREEETIILGLHAVGRALPVVEYLETSKACHLLGQ